MHSKQISKTDAAQALPNYQVEILPPRAQEAKKQHWLRAMSLSPEICDGGTTRGWAGLFAGAVWR